MLILRLYLLRVEMVISEFSLNPNEILEVTSNGLLTM